MAARSLSEVRTALAGPAGAGFARDFADAYFAHALGVMSKSEVDLLVFRLLVEGRVIDPAGSIFTIARALNITPAKARNLLFQYQLRHIDEAQADSMVLGILAKTHYSVDAQRLSFGIESPLARAVIASRLKTIGVFADISFSGEILRVPLSQFGEFVALLMPPDKVRDLEKALKASGDLKKGSLSSFFSTISTEGVKGAAAVGGEKIFSELLKGVSQYVSFDKLDGLHSLNSLFGS
ncbi:hypothetical protein [Sphingomonas sp. YL-JM2C]